MSRTLDLSRLALYAALAGVGSFLLLDLANGDGFSFGLSYLTCALFTEGLAKASCVASGETAGIVPSLLFLISIVAAVGAYLRSLLAIAAGTRLAAAIVHRPGVTDLSLRERIRRAARILTERRRPAPDRAAAALDTLLAPIAGEGVTVSRPAPVRPVVTPPWQARAGQRTGATTNTDRWATPQDDPEERL